MDMDKVDDFISAWLLIDHETGQWNKRLIVALVMIIMYAAGMYSGTLYQSAIITDQINQRQREILEQMKIPLEKSDKTPEPLSI